MTTKAIILSTLVCLFGMHTGNAAAASLSGSLIAWQPLQLDIIGPAARESDTSPNPFLDMRLDVTFTSPSGQRIRVPGFFAGNGLGSGNGTIWRARLTPEQHGDWQYSAQLFSGTDVAVAELSDGFEPIMLAHDTGEFTIAPANKNAPGFLGTGRLAYNAEHYLKFANGSYWLKGGVDSPENFFGYAGFDNTINQPGGVGEAQMPMGVHHYTEHVADWRSGDPLFTSEDTGVDSKGIIGAINYLASEGINSIYFLLMNLGGDGRETYPFIEATGSDYDNTHYDISKLHQWNIVLQHMQSKSIAAHFVLGEQEQDNKNWLDGGELGVQRKLYYREMVARFAYLNAVKWNLSEESRYGNERHLAFASVLRNLDWAEHPIAVHSFVDDPAKAYDALLGNDLFTISSIQFSAENADEFTETWREKSRAAGVPWVIDMDEVGPGNIGLTDTNADQLRREVLYPVYFSGGNVEWYFGFQGADIRTENFRTREPMYRFMRYAREFMEQHLPFWEMQPDDNALIGGDTNDQVFSKPGDTYAIYLNSGNREPRLQVQAGEYTLRWFNPRNGQFDTNISKVSGDEINIGPAPDELQEDWVVLLKQVALSNETSTTDTTSESETGNSAGDSAGTSGAEGTENTGDTTAIEVDTGPDIGAANTAPEPSSTPMSTAKKSGSAGWWFLTTTALLVGFRLLLSFRCWRVLSRTFNMLGVQRIKVNRVE